MVGLLELSASGQVLTTQYNNARTGATLNETTLTPANVNANQFGKLFTLTVDGDVYAQPLYMPHVEIPGKGVHDLLIVATEHDSVYAFDAAGKPAEPLWRVDFLNDRDGVTTIPFRDVSCPFIQPEIGITPTPTIDPQTGTIYVLARTKESQGLLRSARYVQKLHALAITTGAEKFGGPVDIQTDGFDSLRELPRAGLLLSKGQVWLTWASSCDVGPYHGWVMAYDAGTLKQTAVFNASPKTGLSGIWQGDNGPATDAAGHVYVATGNGVFNINNNGQDYGDSALKLRLDGQQIAVADYFTPANESLLNSKDWDLGSGGVVALPDQPAPHVHLLTAGGKDGVAYLLDRDDMRHSLYSVKLGGGLYASPAYWNGHLYYIAANARVCDFAVKNGKLSDDPIAFSTQPFPRHGATPAISANGGRDGILWAIQTKLWNEGGVDKPSVLHAWDASNVSHEIYTTEQNAARDRAGMTLRFTIPTIANGRVYLPARREIDVYGLLR